MNAYYDETILPKSAFKYCLTPTYRHCRFCLLISIIILLLYLSYNSKLPIARTTTVEHAEKFHNQTWTNKTLPTLTRVLYLFLCENQAEVDAYSHLFPSVSADAAFYCWRENCVSTGFRPSLNLYISSWSNRRKRNQTFVRLSPTSPSLSDDEIFHHARSRIFIINEKELQLPKNMTWTTSRNKLYELALAEEKKQGWRWSYFNFGDGDVHTVCPLAEQLLTNRSTTNYDGVEELVFASHFRSFVNLSTSIGEAQCFLLIDAFLFSVSPAIAIVSSGLEKMAFDGLLTQVVYHVDAMFNAFHRDALPFLLPYCARYDARSWWTSQAILVYRSLCLYGHAIQFDGVHVVQKSHRPYPRNGNPWVIDDDMNLVPPHLKRLQNYMQQTRFISPLVLHHYGGWNPTLTSDTCRHYHTAMKLDTCLVYGNDTRIIDHRANHTLI